MEVLSVLIPLLETRKLFIPGRGEVIEAAPGFQLFATQTLFGSHMSSREQAGIFLILYCIYLKKRKAFVLFTIIYLGRIAHHLWTRGVVEPLVASELTTVLTMHFPEIKNLVPKIIGK